MLFARPLPFREALQSAEVRSILPTSLSSAELARIEPELRERARFSAGVTMAEHIQRLDDVVREIIEGKLDFATAKLALKEELDALGYQPSVEDRDTIKDLRSDKRRALQLQVNTRQAQGYGAWLQGQDPDVLDQWPAQELFRAEDREQPRAWLERWVTAGGKLSEGDRMIALKNDPIWEKISAFGVPYPPFDFQSGMDVRDVDRREAESLGLIDQAAPGPIPQTRGFNDDLEVSPRVRSAALRDALLSTGEFKFQDDILTLN